MNKNKELAKEFEFLRDRLKEIARLLVSKVDSFENRSEACFMIGCLHSICHLHIVEFSVKEDEKDE